VALAVVVVSACADDTRSVELSYREIAESCDGCASFELRFASEGHVWFTGLGGCAVPGTHHYRIPPAGFDALVQAFHRAHFFSIRRTGTMAFDSGLVVTSYRDNARVHEVEDRVGRGPELRALERQLRTSGRPERYLTPSPALYEELLRSRWDVNSKNADGWTALRCAISRNHVEAVRVLLKNNAIVSAQDLHVAALFGGATLPLLVPAADLDPRSQVAADILVTLASLGQALSVALGYSIPVDAVGSNGKTALIAAINAASNEYVSPAVNAAVNAASRANVALLLSHGADPNQKLQEESATPLHHAAVSSETGLIDLLRRNGARIDSRDAEGHTPLMRAARTCSYWNIPALLEAGADPRAVASDGRTALELASPKTTTAVGGEFSYNRKNCELTRELLRNAQ
jgi:ankyrin repeat protein